MAELNIGAHCSFKECNQIDFLPIKCQKCDLMFCKLHSVDYQHLCLFSSNVSVNEVSGKGSTLSGHKCSIDDCLVRELIMIICDRCNKQTCLRHRLPEDHSCQGFIKCIKTNGCKILATQGSGLELQIKSDGVELLTTQGAKNCIKHNLKTNPTNNPSKTLAKVMQMKMKMNSIGNESVPLSERIYLNIFYQNQCKPLFFSKELSMGRILDLSAQQFDLKNENQFAFSKKLIFCTFQNKEIALDIKIKDAVENHQLNEFGDIILKYE